MTVDAGIGRVVVFEDTGEERVVTSRCKRCEGSGAQRWDVVSPGGVEHCAARRDPGATLCGIDGTGVRWWWRTW